MNAIVSVTSDWGIGYQGKLLVRNRADMRRFVAMTMGGTVLMGRTTFESFPQGPLRGRHNIVVTRDETYGARHEGIECVHSLDEALALVTDEDPERVWLIGGASLYEGLLARCKRCYVTRNQVLCDADAFFPNLDDNESWELESVEEGGVTDEGISFDFATYANRLLVRG